MSVLFLTALVVSACTTSIAGQPTSAPGASADPTSAKRHTTNMPSAGATLAPDESPLVDDVVDDECVLTAAQYSALSGQAVSEAKQQVVNYGSHKQNSCYYFSETSAGPIGRIDVFAVKGMAPKETVARNVARLNGHPITAVNGAFTAATPKGGTELFAAGNTFLIDVEVNPGPTITDEQWKAAAAQGIQALEG